jgi:hypothetical protein
MRIVFLVASALVLLAALPQHAGAKTIIEISPASGPPGSQVEVHGLGFADGEVQVGVIVLGSLQPPVDERPSMFAEELPDVLVLAMPVAERGEFTATITMPALEAIQQRFGKEVEIVAVQEDPPTSSERYFVARALFSFSSGGCCGLPAAGAGVASSGGLPAALSSASLGAIGLALIALAWRTRGRRGGGIDAHTTQRGPAGP